MAPKFELKALGLTLMLCGILLGMLSYLDGHYPDSHVVLTLVLVMSFALYSLIRTMYIDAETKRIEQLNIDINKIGLK